MFFAVFVVVSLLAAGCGNSEEDTDQKADEQAGQAPEPLDTTSEEVIASYDGLTSGEVKEGEFNRFLNIVMTVNPQMAMFVEQEELKDQMLSQYIATKFQVDGGASLKMVVDPNNTVTLPTLTYFLVR